MLGVLFYPVSVYGNIDAHKVREVITEARTLLFQDARKADSILMRLEEHSAGLPDTLAADVNNIRGIYYAVRGETDLAMRQFLLGLSRSGSLSNQYAGILTNLAITLKQSGKYAASLTVFRQALELYNHLSNWDGIATVLGEMASVHSQRREFYLSVRLLTAAIRIWNTDIDTYRSKRAVDLQKLGNTYLKMGNYSFALKLYSESREAFQILGNSYMEGLTRIQEGEAFLAINDAGSALETLDWGLMLMAPFQNSDILAHGFRLKGLTLLSLYPRDKEEVRINLEKALMYSKLGSRVYWLSVLNSLLEFHAQQESWSAMEGYMQEAVQAVDLKLANADDVRRFSELAMIFYRHRGMYAEAFRYAQKSLVMKDSLRLLEQEAKALELQAKFRLDILEKESQLHAARAEWLDAKLRFRNRSLYLISALLLFVSLATLFMIRVFRLKQELSHIKLKHALKTKQVVEQQNQVLAENLLLKEKLVHTQRLQLEQNAVEVMSLNAQLESTVNKESVHVEGTGVPAMQGTTSDTQYWKSFMEQFKRVNPDFMQSLENACPGLSRSEQEFCVLIKLGMSYKEIANILQISHSSAITKKYRICRKLKITSDTDFYSFIREID